ncbi:hypothetical protein HDF18_01470 [Mucilaginibacter sp. X5P1]|uniref:sulfotransferase family protein n=1 Tax=Mucilaginibacter sp. X5P1 TaxID=2723088 RepID=UPI001619D840|nr:sulfotransferase family protein [Mucilaginibacter sp. X5P1]MBB6138224.1 hypothetical protein [Mucilaginibacter sp. X5P1]
MLDFPLNWVPYKLLAIDGRIKCCWLNTYGESFTEPFFDETILKCKGLDGSHAAISSVSDLMMIGEWASGGSAIEPTAFIFHVSRCGSTLISQLLATLDENIVLAEVPCFDDILRLPYKYPEFDRAAIAKLFTDTLSYYGQKRTNKEKNLFIKTDSWHLFFYEQLRQLYPAVPFIILYRSPGEVFNSHRKQPGMQAVNGLIEPQLFGFDANKVANMSPDAYLAAVIESYFKKCLEIAAVDDQFLLLNYNEGAMQMIEKIAAFTKATLTPQDVLNMTERSRYHSKKQGEIFSEKVTHYVPSNLNKAVELYNLLEEKRKATN